MLQVLVNIFPGTWPLLRPQSPVGLSVLEKPNGDIQNGDPVRARLENYSKYWSAFVYGVQQAIFDSCVKSVGYSNHWVSR